MFRTDSEDRFGVGSAIKNDDCSPLPRYVVVLLDNNCVTLMNWSNCYVMLDNRVQVQDPNHLSLGEVRVLVDRLEDGWTFSDYSFDAKGIK